MADEMERIEKALEGNGLALSAVAEVLQKMDARLEKDDRDKEEEEEMQEAAVEKAALVKELATEVANMLKADQGMDVDGSKERKAKTTGGSSSKADDSESAANISSKIEDQQATIQAMRKEDAPEEGDKEEEYPVDEKAHDAEEEDVDDTEAKGYKKAHGDDSEEDDDKAPTELENMQKELDSLRLQLAEFENGIEKAVETESENRLRKMGFREETGLVAPQLSALGTDGTTPIIKSASEGDTVDQLAELSYGELRALQLKIQAGDTNGVPRELL
tara:strand:+ start:1241 stop:2065 length:825 start_codon:yes stop_codon:yes gene_type:complete